MPIRRSPATFLARSAVSARRRGEPSLGGRLKADRVAALIAAAGAGLVGDADLEAGVDVFGIGELTAGTDDFAQNQRSPSPPPARRSSSGSSRSGYICQEQDPVGCVPVLWCAINIGGSSGISCRRVRADRHRNMLHELLPRVRHRWRRVPAGSDRDVRGHAGQVGLPHVLLRRDAAEQSSRVRRLRWRARLVVVTRRGTWRRPSPAARSKIVSRSM